VEPLSLVAARAGKAARQAAPEAPEPTEPEEVNELIERIETTRFLGAELLLWLWLRAELISDPLALGKLGEVELWLDRKLTLEHILDRTERVAVVGAQPSGSPEAREAVRNLKLPVAARLVLRLGEQDFAFDLNAPRFLVGSGSIPAVLKQESDDAFLERTALIEQLTALLDAVFAAFLRERLAPSWIKSWEPALGAWVEGKNVPASALKEIAASTRAARRLA
jgi:hypothetical protein